MALFNHAKKEVNAKLVYFGPGSGGKETSIGCIYRKLAPESRSPFKSMAIQGNRMHFFDFNPSEKGIEGYSVRFHLYTVPDEVLTPSTWKTVLKGADGVVFVADSAPDRLEENMIRLKELEGFLATTGASLDNIPFVMQYNRRDDPEACSLDELQRRLNRFNAPVFPSVAVTGEGVLQPLSSLVKMVLSRIRDELAEKPAILTDLVPIPLPEETAALREDLVIEPEPPAQEIVLPDVENEEDERNAAEGPDVCAEIALTEMLPDGRIRVPLKVSSGDTRREYRLVISLHLEDSAHGA